MKIKHPPSWICNLSGTFTLNIFQRITDKYENTNTQTYFNFTN